jgi:GDPmannose 4,6-dehydratase/GDP-4-dehydro-6-deoxy-D-mannose reductase
MKALITGITGFVGSHLAELLLRKGNIEVYGLKRWRSPLSELAGVLKDVRLVDCDLRDANAVNRAVAHIRPDRIYHLAAQSYVPVSYHAPVDTFETNACGTINLLEAVRMANIDPIIHVCSSSEVYGQVRLDEVPIRETNPLRPSSPYAVSKVAEDMIAFQYFTSYNLRTIRTRAFTHTGPRRGEVFVESSFAKQIAEIEEGKNPPVVFVGNLNSIRTFLDVRDICEAYYLATDKGVPGEVYNIGGSRTMSVGEMLNHLLSLSPKKIQIVQDPARLRPSDVTLQIPDVSKFMNQSGWKPTIPFEKTMQDLLEYWRIQTGASIRAVRTGAAV